MKLRVELLPDAEANLDHILAWLSEKSPQGATAWYRRWLEVIADLEERAGSYPRAPEGMGLDRAHFVDETGRLTGVNRGINGHIRLKRI